MSDAAIPPVAPAVTEALLRAWRRRELEEARVRYDGAAPKRALRRRAPHRRLSAAFGDWLSGRAIRLAAYGHRRPSAHIAARLLDAELLEQESDRDHRRLR